MLLLTGLSTLSVLLMIVVAIFIDRVKRESLRWASVGLVVVFTLCMARILYLNLEKGLI